MFPLTNSLHMLLTIYRDNDTTRPDRLIECIEKRPNPKASLTSLFNHLLQEKENESDLGQALIECLQKKYFVHVVPGKPIILTKKCFVKVLNLDALLYIAPWLELRDLVAFGGACRAFRDAAMRVLQSGRLPVHISGNKKAASFPFAGVTSCIMSHCNEESVKTLEKTHPHLRKIHLHRCEEVKGFNFPNLQSLKLFGHSITDRMLLPILRAHRQVKAIDLEFCANITGSALAEAKTCKNLEELSLQGTSVQGVHLKTILLEAQKLRRINLSHCDMLTKGDFDSLVYPKSIEKVIVYWTAIYNNGPP